MINQDRLLETFLAILRFDSYYPNEHPVVEPLRPKLARVGLQLSTDEHRNVLGFWPGTGELAEQDPTDSVFKPYQLLNLAN